MKPKHLRYKINVLEAMKAVGYTSARIRKEKLIGEQMLQKIRQGDLPSWTVLEKICEILKCTPGDIIEYVPDMEEESEE